MKSHQMFQIIGRRQAGIICSLVLTLACAGTSVWGQVKPKHREDIPNFDKRSAAAQKQGMVTGQQQAVAKLGAKTAVAVDFDPLLQTPQFLRSRGGFLTGPSGQGITMPAKAFAAPPSADAVIRAFIDEHAAVFGHDSTLLQGSRIKRDYADEQTGLRTIVWEQQLDEIPIFQATFIGHVTKKGELVSISSLFVPSPAAAAEKGTPGRAALQQNPPLSVTDAFVAGARNLGFALDPAVVTETQGVELESGYRLFKTPDAAFARLVWLPLDRSSLRLAWEVMVSHPKTKERFRVIVDAQTGEPYLRHTMTWYISDASYAVYTSDSPSPFTPSLQVPGNFQPPYTNRILMVGPALDTNASPVGWIDDGNNTTTGNNADAFVDRDFDQQPDAARPVGNPNRVFNFPLDLATEPTNYIDASTVQLFFRANWYHDRLYQLGFTEAVGNYQERNFGRGGFGGDSVICYVQSGADIGIADNAMFAPAPDGYNGQCFMFVFSGPTPQRDGSLDQEVVIHEFTHGTSSRLVGGGMAMNTIQAGGLGEGWSDFYALALLSETNDNVHEAYATGGYATYNFFGLDQNYYYGIRHFPYCTDMTKNPFTFKDIDPTQIDPHTGVPRSPIYPYDSREADEVHHQGEVWCSILWEVRANLIDKHGFRLGNELTLLLVTDGMKLSPPNPNFVQARDAILQADLIRTGGLNATDMWRGFAKRGLGASARSPSSDTTIGVVEAFDVIGLQVQGAFVQGGNGNGVVDYDECNDLYIVLINGGTVGATNVQVSISTTTPKAYVMERTANYPNLQANGLATNLTPFKISTGPTFVCGTPIALKLVIKSDAGTQGADLLLPTGTNGAPIRFNSFFPIVIPDGYTPGTNSLIFVTNVVGAVQNVVVSLHSVHTYDADLTFELIGPDGTRVLLSDRNGGANQNYGLACFPDTSRTTFNDQATNLIANGRAPFLGSFKPEEPLAAFIGKSGTNINGIWTLRAVDNTPLDVGTLECWSLILEPASCKPGGGQCPGVDISVGMTAKPDPAVVGSNLVYTVVVTNRGPGTSIGTVVSHNLPGGALFVSATSSQGTCSQAGGAVTATLGNLGADEMATVTVTVIPTLVGTAFSSASVSSTEPELNPFDNYVSIQTIVAPPSSDLAVGLTDTPDPSRVGGPLTYTVAVTNNGPATASAVVVTNRLPAGLLLGAIENSQGSIVIQGNDVVFNVGLLPRNAYATATINVTPQVFGVLTATAQATAIQPDPFLANNTAATTTTIGQASDLALGITARPDPTVLGSNLTFSITVTNLGPNTATNVAVTQSLPAGTGTPTISLSQGSYTLSGGTLVCSLGTLQLGGSANVRVVVATTRVGTLTSEATVTSAQSDPFSENNSGVASAQVAPPFVSIVASGTTLTAENYVPPNGSVDAGETVTIQFRLQNNGNVANTNLIGTLLPTGGVSSPSGPQPYGIIRPIGVPGGAPVSRPFTFTAPVGGSGVVTATLQLQDGQTPLAPVIFTFALPKVYRFSNTNSIVIPTSGSASPYPSAIEASGISGQLGRVTATLSKFSHDYPHDVSVLLVGPSAVKTLLLSHAGDRASTYNVDLTFDDGAEAKLPPSGGLLQGVWQPSVYGPGVTFSNPAPGGPYGALLSDFNGLAGNGVWSLYAIDDTAGDGGVIANGWSIELTAVTPVNQLADVGVSVTALPSPVLVGDALTYTWTITNSGPATATGVAFSNPLPASVVFSSASISQGNWSTNDNVLEANLGNLAAGASATLVAVVQPQVGSPEVLTNTGHVTAFESDLHTGNNRATSFAPVSVPLVGLSLSMTAFPDPVIVGSNLTFRVSLTNSGPNNALDVKLSDPLPPGTIFSSANVSQGSVVYTSGAVTASLGNVAAGAAASFEVTLMPQSSGVLTNTVILSTASSDSIVGRSVSTSVAVNEPAATIVTAGAILESESRVPPNGTVEPGETVTVSLALANTGVLNAGNLTATLEATGGVTSPSGPVAYGMVAAGGAPIARSFTFTADPAAQGAIIATLQLRDGEEVLGSVVFNFALPVTTTFSSSAVITIPEYGTGLPYPATINVSGLSGIVGKVTVGLRDLTHSFPTDLSVLVASPAAPEVLLMSHNGGSYAITNVNLIFDDQAASQLSSSGRIASGSYRPSRYGQEITLPPPAPLAPYASTLAAFEGINPNGTWALYAVDEAIGDGGAIASGWTLSITTLNPVNPLTDVQLVVAGAPAAVPTGSSITYSFAVTNAGPAVAENTILTDSLPEGFTVMSNSISQGTVTQSGREVVFRFGAVPVGASVTATITAVPTMPGNFVNVARLSGGFTDLAPANNVVETFTTVFSLLPPTLSAEISGGLLQLTGKGQPAAEYIIEASTGLNSWSAVSTNRAGADGVFRYTDPDTAQYGARYYRAVRLMP